MKYDPIAVFVGALAFIAVLVSCITAVVIIAFSYIRQEWFGLAVGLAVGEVSRRVLMKILEFGDE